jgi:hypothetical protein
MSSIKCPTCGFVRLAIEENCRRCLAASNQNKSHQSWQKTGAWRDRWWLVKHLEVPLDETCIKCGETKDVSREPVKVEALSAWSFLTHLAGIHVFRWLQFEIPLCRRHRYGMDKVVVGTIVAGALIMIVGIAGIRASVILPLALFVAGFLTIGAGVVLYLIRRERVSVWRYKHPYVWLWGVHRNYLERLPNWSRKV